MEAKVKLHYTHMFFSFSVTPHVGCYPSPSPLSFFVLLCCPIYADEWPAIDPRPRVPTPSDCSRIHWCSVCKVPAKDPCPTPRVDFLLPAQRLQNPSSM